MSEDVIVIKQSKSKAIRLFISSAAFMGLCIYFITQGKSGAWFLVAFWSLGLIATGYGLLPGAGQLRIDRNGIRVNRLFKPLTLNWNDINHFYVNYVTAGPATARSLIKVIAIDYSQSFRSNRPDRKFSMAVMGQGGTLPDNFTLAAEEVCQAVNEAKQKYSAAEK